MSDFKGRRYFSLQIFGRGCHAGGLLPVGLGGLICRDKQDVD